MGKPPKAVSPSGVFFAVLDKEKKLLQKGVDKGV